MPDSTENLGPPQNAWSPEGKFLIPPQVLQQIMAAQLATARPPARRGPVVPPGGGGGFTSPLPADRLPPTDSPFQPPPTSPIFDPPPNVITPTVPPGAPDAPNTMNPPQVQLPPQLPIGGGMLGGDIPGIMDLIRPPPLTYESEFTRRTNDPVLSNNPVLSAISMQTPQIEPRSLQQMLGRQNQVGRGGADGRYQSGLLGMMS